MRQSYTTQRSVNKVQLYDSALTSDATNVELLLLLVFGKEKKKNLK